MVAHGLNGRTGEMVRWIVGLALAGLVSYFTAIGTLQKGLAVVQTTEELHFQQLRDDINDLKLEMRAMRERRP